jgi:hypothetical protein
MFRRRSRTTVEVHGTVVIAALGMMIDVDTTADLDMTTDMMGIGHVMTIVVMMIGLDTMTGLVMMIAPDTMTDVDMMIEGMIVTGVTETGTIDAIEARLGGERKTGMVIDTRRKGNRGGGRTSYQ